jgi:hypothetical protein
MASKNKYLKYKEKYLALKMQGGVKGTIDERLVTIDKRLQRISEVLNTLPSEEKINEKLQSILEEVMSQGIQMRAVLTHMAAQMHR